MEKFVGQCVAPSNGGFPREPLGRDFREAAQIRFSALATPAKELNLIPPRLAAVENSSEPPQDPMDRLRHEGGRASRRIEQADMELEAIGFDRPVDESPDDNGIVYQAV